MKLYTNAKEPVRFIEVKTLKSKATGEPFKIVAFGNQVTFERFEFFLNDSIDLSGITSSDELQLILDATKSGYANKFNLAAVRKVK